jgi:hypothetical protein
MNVVSATRLYGGHRVRVMWERPAGIWRLWPFKNLRKPVPIYVFIGYILGVEQPLRICLPGEGSVPFVIEDPLAYDGGNYNHGPYPSASRYDAENTGHTLAQLFAMLHDWATDGSTARNPEEQQALRQALDGFYDWIWREHRRDRNVVPGIRAFD